MPLPLDCDIAAVLEELAKKSLVNDDPAAAADLLSRGERFVEDSPLARQLWPVALMERGELEIKAESAAAAITTFEEAERRSAQDLRMIRLAKDGHVRALLLDSFQKAERDSFKEALESAGEAHRIGPSGRTADAFGAVRLRRADWASRRGRWQEAREDLRQARRRPKFAALAAEGLAQLRDAPESISRIHRMSWVRLPDVAGRTVAGKDYLYFGRTGEIVGWATRANPSIVVFTVPPEHTRVAAIIRDTKGDGIFDEFQERDEYGRSTVLMDVDEDGRPDLRLRYGGGVLQSEEALSGKILFRIAAGAIADTTRMFTPDPYFAVYQDGTFLMRSKTVKNSYQPTFNDGVVIDYKYHDAIQVDLWGSQLILAR